MKDTLNGQEITNEELALIRALVVVAMIERKERKNSAIYNRLVALDEKLWKDAKCSR